MDGDLVVGALRLTISRQEQPNPQKILPAKKKYQLGGPLFGTGLKKEKNALIGVTGINGPPHYTVL